MLKMLWFKIQRKSGAPVLVFNSFSFYYFSLYSWQVSEPAAFPTEQLELELRTKTGREPTFSKWERTLFYWMPNCSLSNELDRKSRDVESTSSEESESSSQSQEMTEMTIEKNAGEFNC